MCIRDRGKIAGKGADNQRDDGNLEGAGASVVDVNGAEDDCPGNRPEDKSANQSSGVQLDVRHALSFDSMIAKCPATLYTSHTRTPSRSEAILSLYVGMN